jgi:hypothetical protein
VSRIATAGSGAALGLVVGLQPAGADAHAIVDGIGGFYAGLLHPVLVPAEALGITALALLLGSSGRSACRAGLPALLAGIIGGFFLGRHFPPSWSTPSLLGVAFLAAVLVAAGTRLPAPAASLIAALTGLAVGIDAQPEGGELRQFLTASAEVLLGATALALILAGLVIDRQRGWPRIVARVVGSWITACAILYFAWAATSAPT